MEQTINEMTINGKVYVEKGTASPVFNGDIKIVVLQRGWVYVGRFEKDGNLCRLHNASCIRQWGTTNGLPQLVNGPTSSTKLDKCEGVVEFDWLTVVHTIACNPSKWSL